MKRLSLFFLSLCMVMLVVALIFVAVPPVNGVNQMTTVATAMNTVAPIITAGTVANATHNDTLYAVVGGAILLTAMAFIAVRKRLTEWKISAMRLTTSLKARGNGFLAAGDQLKFPLLTAGT